MRRSMPHFIVRDGLGHAQTVPEDGRFLEDPLRQNPQDAGLGHVLGAGRGRRQGLTGVHQPPLPKDQSPTPGQPHVYRVVELAVPKVRVVPRVLGEAHGAPRIEAGTAALQGVVGELQQQRMRRDYEILAAAWLPVPRGIHLVLVGGKGIPTIGIVPEDSPVVVDAVNGAHEILVGFSSDD
mmetsp:Transcript_15299/g.17711  ORF Transcript_15299/g.17711 Transcript_15299/m.17711 type:complete len:181 (+) Transcript_15299:162-704(+)